MRSGACGKPLDGHSHVEAVDAQAGAAATLESLSSELLGFPTDTRVLIVNCDDLGMHKSVNAAVFEGVQEGIASSASLMVPCPAAE